MKRLYGLCLAVAISAAGATVQAEDSAVEQRLNEISGRIENLLESQESQRKHITELSRELDHLREKLNKPQPDYASQEDVRRLAEAMREVDRKRLDDYERIREELRKLGRTIRESAATPPAAPAKITPAPSREPAEPVSEKGFEHVVQKGDSLSTIVKAYRDKNIKVTMEQVLKANPGLNKERMPAGKKIWIPAP